MRLNIWVISIIIGALLGIIISFSNVELNTATLILIVVSVFVILAVPIIRIIYILRYSHNMQAVEKLLRKLARTVPYYAAMADLLDGSVDSAAARMGNINNDKLRAVIGANVAFAADRWQEAEQHINQLSHSDAKHVGRALIRLMQDDLNGFESAKRLVEHPGFVHALEANAAFHRGDITKAEEQGELAIQATAGLQRYAYIRYRELRSKQPDRKTFF
ncbi:hypothetical protein [Paenibacillus xylaniclasticus]|uniref:hypothetical protein n=1 Tax=Paenibacillus xylaniclasticus TaxID=588083 RepID=UPI000FDCA0B6|nr:MULTISPECIES: hypothetical protein [Paenibacillus]GFN30101.1 hypothetical protein PCURB6_03610 [Paenibacillus curdlanolyticus]